MITFASERVALELPAGSVSKDLCFALLMSFLSNLRKKPLIFLSNLQIKQLCHNACSVWLNRSLISWLCQGSPLQHKEKKIV